MTQHTIEDFGTALIKSEDLDPVYTAICAAKLDDPTLHRLSLAYWCLYHLGAAAKLAESKQPKRFWDGLMTAAVNEGLKWPRGSERRHFRGRQAVNAVADLSRRYKTASDAVSYMFLPVDGAQPTYGGVAARVQEHTGFGPWIAFKIADMGERVLGFPVDFTRCELGIYKDPRQGAALAWYEIALASNKVVGTYKTEPWNYPIGDDDLRAIVAHYVKHFSKFKAPPHNDRKVNVQEVETIFCKYKSHRKGHYPLGKDTREVAHALDGWGDLAQQLKQGLPPTQHQLF